MRVLNIALIGLLISSLFSCGKDDSGNEIEDLEEEEIAEEQKRPSTIEEYNSATDGLKDYFADCFLMGAAIEPSSLDNEAEVALIKRHFNSITAENVMKWSSLQPTEGSYKWTNANKIVDFAQENGLKVRGHTLVWHNQVPSWVFEDNGATASKELVLQRMRNHITEVMTRYKSKVYAWDVVNEAIDDGSDTYKSTSKWYSICGEDFIFEAFKAARAADPDAKLFYNDYSATQPVKRDKIYNLLKKLKDEDLIDGVGLQGHWNIGAPDNSLIIDAITKYSSLGIDVQITELDVSIYNNDIETEMSYSARETLHVNAYLRFFTLLRLYKNKISGVTFWGVADNHTWLDNFPVSGRKNYPFLFGTDYNPKKAYFSVIDF